MLTLSSISTENKRQKIECFNDNQSFGSSEFPSFPKKVTSKLVSLLSGTDLAIINKAWLIHDFSHAIGIQILNKIQPEQSQHIFSEKAEYLTVALTNRLFPDRHSIRIRLPFSGPRLMESAELRESDALLLTAEIALSTIIESHPKIERAWRKDLMEIVSSFQKASETDRNQFVVTVPEREFDFNKNLCLTKIQQFKDIIAGVNCGKSLGKILAIEELGGLGSFIIENQIALNCQAHISKTMPSQRVEEGLTLKKLNKLPLYTESNKSAEEIFDTLFNLHSEGSFEFKPEIADD